MVPRRTYELVLAVLGIVAWFGLAVVDLVFEDYLFGALAAFLGALSVVEVLRWQRGQPTLGYSSRRRADKGLHAVPQTAWFGVGAVAGSTLFAFLWGFVEGARGTTRPELPVVALFLAWVVPGYLVSWLLTRASDLQKEHARVSPYFLPPPPGPASYSPTDHAAAAYHEVGEAPAIRLHLQNIHGVDVEPDLSGDRLAEIHTGLHPPRFS